MSVFEKKARPTAKKLGQVSQDEVDSEGKNKRCEKENKK